MAFGALTNSTTANTIGTLTINGANGYGVSFTSLALSSGTTGVATTLVANAPVAITGGVSNAMTVTAAKGDTLVLDGVSTGSMQEPSRMPRAGRWRRAASPPSPSRGRAHGRSPGRTRSKERRPSTTARFSSTAPVRPTTLIR